MQRAKEEEEKRLKREAYARELERRAKTAEARAETDRILADQAERVRQRKMQMDAADAERAKRLQQEAHERHLANIEKRKKAEQRITSALASSHEILRKRRDDFERKERDAEVRRLELEKEEKRSMEMKRQQELEKERDRQNKYLTAVEIEEGRKKAIRDKAEAKEREMAELAAARKREQDIRRVEREFELKRRLDRVDEIQKVRACAGGLLGHIVACLGKLGLSGGCGSGRAAPSHTHTHLHVRVPAIRNNQTGPITGVVCHP